MSTKELKSFFTNLGKSRLMQMFQPSIPNPAWCANVFAAKTADRGGVIRRSVRDVDREVGRDNFLREVRRRGFHLIECGGQYIVICNAGNMQILC